MILKGFSNFSGSMTLGKAEEFLFPGLEHTLMPKKVFDCALFGDLESCVPSSHSLLSPGAGGCYPTCSSACWHWETEAHDP